MLTTKYESGDLVCREDFFLMAINNAQSDFIPATVFPPQMRFPLMANDLDAWFYQNESSMALRGINSQAKKFHATITALPTNIIPEIKDFLDNVPEQNQYDMLKEVLIARTSISQEHKIKKLLTTEALGDSRPSQFLRRLRSLAGGPQNDNIVQQLFLQNMPENIRFVLSALDRNLSLDEVAAVADRMMERSDLNTPSVSAAKINPQQAPNNDPDLVGALVRHIEALTQRLLTQPSQNEQHRTGRSFARNEKKRRNSRSNSPSPYCFYHRQFGPRAFRCKQPCSYNTSTSSFSASSSTDNQSGN